MKILVLWFSKTGSVQALAHEAANRLSAGGHQVRSVRLKPRVELPYLLWLALSFLPGSRSPLRKPTPDPSGYDACLLALPKWTFSCPPVNSFLASWGRKLPPTAVLVVFGGWDQVRYTEALTRRVAALGTQVLGTLLAKKKRIGEAGAARELEAFLDRCFPPCG